MNREEKVKFILSVIATCSVIAGIACFIAAVMAYNNTEPHIVPIQPEETVTIDKVNVYVTITVDEPLSKPETDFSPESIDYLAKCVQAEAENQSELGKRLVCDTVLNRYDSGRYTSLEDVINEENNGVYQYSVVEDGRIHEAEPTEDIYRIVNEELTHRTDTEVLYFRTKRYHTFGTPMFKEDDHYFSKN